MERYSTATCTELWAKVFATTCDVLSGYDMTSYLYGKGKTRALNTLLSGQFPGLANIIGEMSI